MILIRTDAFERDFRALPRDIQGQVEKALRLLAENPRHPSLQAKKMEPKSEGIFESRATRSYRFTFEVGKGRIVLRRVGTHDILRTP